MWCESVHVLNGINQSDFHALSENMTRFAEPVVAFKSHSTQTLRKLFTEPLRMWISDGIMVAFSGLCLNIVEGTWL